MSDLLLLELEAALPRVGRFGEGVFVGPVSAAVGLDADLVIVAGLTEDAYPGRRREDALLGAQVRERSGEPRDAGDRLDAQHRHLLAAFASAPRVISTFPRGDLRNSAQRLPSRWLLQTLRALTARPDLVAVDWDRYPAAGVIGVRSYASELLSTARPATEQEWRQCRRRDLGDQRPRNTGRSRHRRDRPADPSPGLDDIHTLTSALHAEVSTRVVS